MLTSDGVIKFSVSDDYKTRVLPELGRYPLRLHIAEFRYRLQVWLPVLDWDTRTFETSESCGHVEM